MKSLDFRGLCTADEVEAIDRQVTVLGLNSGDTVVLCLSNRNLDALVALLLVQRFMRVLIMPEQSRVSEKIHYGEKSGARGILTLQDGRIDFQALKEPQSQALTIEPGILLLTSGSTGQPKLIFRSLDSWMTEAGRYIRLLDLGPQHRVLLIAPLNHAYILGWLWAAWAAGAQIAMVNPNELGLIASKLKNWATHAALTPNIARLVVMRQRKPGPARNLEVVMAGAGPVSEELDLQFDKAFAVRLSTNYGSTETGALFAGLAPTQAYTIGQPMPGVTVIESTKPCTSDDIPFESGGFPLVVNLEGDGEYHTGDIVTEEQGLFRVVGRQSTAIRRGERWISPLEIEAVLQQSPWVTDSSVRGVPAKEFGNDRIVAAVVLAPDQSCTEAQLLDFCATRLSPYKVPDVIDVVSSIPRDEKGKQVSPPRFRCADSQSLLQAANAYKRSHLLFALYEAGVIAMLEEGQTVDQMALNLGIRPSFLASVLEVASYNGILTNEQNGRKPVPLNTDVGKVIELEQYNRQGFNSIERLIGLLKRGRPSPLTGSVNPGSPVYELYLRAMQGGHKKLSMRLVERRLASSTRHANHKLRVLDISATDGLYLSHFTSRGLCNVEASRMVPVGHMVRPTDGQSQPMSAGKSWNEVIQPEYQEKFDLLVFDNAIHHEEVVRTFDHWLSRLTPGGWLVIDDLFLSHSSGDIGVDWLTHGGIEFMGMEGLKRFFRSKGFSMEAIWNGGSGENAHKVFLLHLDHEMEM